MNGEQHNEISEKVRSSIGEGQENHSLSRRTNFLTTTVLQLTSTFWSRQDYTSKCPELAADIAFGTIGGYQVVDKFRGAA